MHVLQELQVEAAPTPTGYIPHQGEVGGVGVAKARTPGNLQQSVVVWGHSSPAAATSLALDSGSH